MKNKLENSLMQAVKKSEISMRAGRAPFYLVFDDGKLTEKIKNVFAKGGGGAGFSVAYMLADKNIDLVIAGQIGGNMQSALKERQVEFKEQTGKIEDNLKKVFRK